MLNGRENELMLNIQRSASYYGEPWPNRIEEDRPYLEHLVELGLLAYGRFGGEQCLNLTESGKNFTIPVERIDSVGSKHLGVDEKITLELQRETGIDSFIETGSFKGGTSAWAANHFRHVITIEGMPGRWWKTWNNTLGQLSNVATLLGESGDLLPRILSVLQVPAIFWLDAHYCTTNHDEQKQGLSVCPVMHELLAINAHACAHLHVIMVDDARLFGIEKGWPREDVLLSELRKYDRQCILYEDVWYAIPAGLTFPK